MMHKYVWSKSRKLKYNDQRSEFQGNILKNLIFEMNPVFSGQENVGEIWNNDPQ